MVWLIDFKFAVINNLFKQLIFTTISCFNQNKLKLSNKLFNQTLPFLENRRKRQVETINSFDKWWELNSYYKGEKDKHPAIRLCFCFLFVHQFYCLVNFFHFIQVCPSWYLSAIRLSQTQFSLHLKFWVLLNSLLLSHHIYIVTYRRKRKHYIIL